MASLIGLPAWIVPLCVKKKNKKKYRVHNGWIVENKRPPLLRDVLKKGRKSKF